MGGEGSSKQSVATQKTLGFINTVFSWSLEDIFNDNLYKDQVEKIPLSFQSVEQYLGSYILPLLDETRAAMRSSMEIIARAPYAEVRYLDEAKPDGKLLFDVNVDYWRNRFSDRAKEPYKTLPGDIFVVADAKPETASDLQRVGRTWTFALVTSISGFSENSEDDDEDNSSSTSFKVKALEDLVSKDEMHKSLFVVFLTNVTTNRRIWNALHMMRNLKIIKEVLHAGPMVEESCSLCSSQIDGTWNEVFLTNLLSQLNESQTKAVLVCLNKMQCSHKSHVELIWGPPGTGKTKTINDSFGSLGLGDILLFGTKEKLQVNSEIEEIFLDYRVKRLTECLGLGPLGWWHCFTSMITFLEDCVSQYHVFLENESNKEREYGSENDNQEKEWCIETDRKKAKHKSFLEYARERFASTALPLRRCVSILYTHIPKTYFLELNFQDLETLLDLLDSFETLLFLNDVVSEEVEELFLHSKDDKLLPRNFSDASLSLCSVRSQCLSVLKAIRDSLSKLKLPRGSKTLSPIRLN
ncbi:hypothetical protein REPUB_Repub04eG0218000 [Reevesia pubescens]